MRTCLLLLCVSVSAAWPSAAGARDDVRVYRCTGTQGQVALRDSPCEAGEQQEVRTMQRPVDGTPLPRPAPPATPAPAATPAPQVIVVNAPQPMYRCVRPDGSDYTSDSGDGNPRWVPLWTTGYGHVPPRLTSGTRVDARIGRGDSRVEIDHSVQSRRAVPGYGYGGAGTWVRDDCRRMPQAEVCSLIAARREAIRQRFFNAQPTERGQLRGEESAINARLAQDCQR